MDPKLLDFQVLRFPKFGLGRAWALGWAWALGRAGPRAGPWEGLRLVSLARDGSMPCHVMASCGMPWHNLFSISFHFFLLETDSFQDDRPLPDNSDLFLQIITERIWFICSKQRRQRTPGKKEKRLKRVKWHQMGPAGFVSVLIQTLPTFWAERILI